MLGSLMRARKRSRIPTSMGRAGPPGAEGHGPRRQLDRPPVDLVQELPEVGRHQVHDPLLDGLPLGAETLWRTALSAQSAFRPRSGATDRMKAAASFSIFFIDSLSAWPPPARTGWAAPGWWPGPWPPRGPPW